MDSQKIAAVQAVTSDSIISRFSLIHPTGANLLSSSNRKYDKLYHFFFNYLLALNYNQAVILLYPLQAKNLEITLSFLLNKTPLRSVKSQNVYWYKDVQSSFIYLLWLVFRYRCSTMINMMPHNTKVRSSNHAQACGVCKFSLQMLRMCIVLCILRVHNPKRLNIFLVLHRCCSLNVAVKDRTLERNWKLRSQLFRRQNPAHKFAQNLL